jgi:hypothetical protein
MNGLLLKICVMDYGASSIFISLKVMEKLGLNTTQLYENLFGINSNKVKVYVPCENVEVFLFDFLHISLCMNILVIDVSDPWGIILSRIWYASLGGFLNTDLTHTHIPM